MNQQLADDIRAIFNGSIDQHTLDVVINQLDHLLSSHTGGFTLRSRNDGGKILNFQGTKYFSLICDLRPKPVVFAGALEKHRGKGLTPSIRFRNANLYLASVNKEFKFPYRKPGWTCVCLTQETIQSLGTLMSEEITVFQQKYLHPTAVEPVNLEQSKTSDALLVSATVAFLLGLILALVGLVNQDTALVLWGLLILVVGVIVGVSNTPSPSLTSLSHSSSSARSDGNVECPFCHSHITPTLKKQGGIIKSTVKGAVFLPWGVKEIMKKNAYYCPSCGLKISDA